MLDKNDLHKVRTIVREEAKKIVRTETKQIVQKEFKKIDKKLDLIIRVFDRDIIHTKKRVDRIENHLDLPPLI